ncbi:MAG: hypothetical protein AAF629_04145 [Chloroflexota bacterium]
MLKNRKQARMAQAGAHFVVEGIGDIPLPLEEINARLKRGEHS